MSDPGWYSDPTVERWWDGREWSSITRVTGADSPGGPVAVDNAVTPAGFYPDPIAERWWDGAAWTEKVRTAEIVGSEVRAEIASPATEPPNSTMAPGSARPSYPRYLPQKWLAVAGLVVVAVGLYFVFFSSEDPGPARNTVALSTSTTIDPSSEPTNTLGGPSTTLVPVALPDTYEECRRYRDEWLAGRVALVPANQPPYRCGQESPEIEEAQVLLNQVRRILLDMGCEWPHDRLEVDGRFGPATFRAVWLFRDSQILLPVGELDQRTLDLLTNASNLMYQVCPEPFP